MRAKIEELTSKQNTPVANEDDDYLTEQELHQKQKLEDVERQLNELKQKDANSEARAVELELNSFAQAQDEDGNLKRPYFDRVRQNMSLLFQSDQNGTMTLEKAYNKAVLLDDELSETVNQELLLKEKLKQKAALDKVKKNKKYSPNSTSGNRQLSARELNEKAISELYS